MRHHIEPCRRGLLRAQSGARARRKLRACQLVLTMKCIAEMLDVVFMIGFVRQENLRS